MIAAIAQVPDLNWQTFAVVYGPMGMGLAWFAFRAERKMGEIVTELSVLGHRLNGMTRAMLTDVASRETTGDAVRALVQKEIDKLESEDEVKELRRRNKS